MAMFVDGAYFQKDFGTDQGSVTVLAEAHLFGDHLVLDELLFYPTEGAFHDSAEHALNLILSEQNRPAA